MSLRGAFIFSKKILFNHSVKEVSSGDGKVANVSALQKLITIFHFSYEKNFAQTYGNEKEANSKLSQNIRFCACAPLLF